MTRKQIEAAKRALTSRLEDIKSDLRKYQGSPNHPTTLTLNNMYGVGVMMSEMLSAVLEVTPEDGAQP